MQTSNFILINHDVYGKKHAFISFPFLLKFICLHYLDQLHLVSSHASRQMFTMCLLVCYLLSSTETRGKTENYDSSRKFSRFSFSFRWRTRGKGKVYKNVLFPLARMAEILPKRLIFLSRSFQSLSF
jgi:hypothetical protein